ncbi:MAG: glycoside hydrolase family 97 catalytic domain-containing protein [Bryobacterales bacterium]|nr:glycoside hydrolase family 97 catalytic domain-containing protein [Bryobacterales bacterium]
MAPRTPSFFPQAIGFALFAVCLGLLLAMLPGKSFAQPGVVEPVFPPDRSYTVYLRWPMAAARMGLPQIEVLSPKGSRLALIDVGIATSSLPPLSELRVDRMSPFSRHEEWQPLYGERSRYPDAFRGMLVQLAPRPSALPVAEIEIRAYNEGLAWRLSFPQGGLASTVRVDAETTTFAFPKGTMGWATYRAQARYERVPVEAIKEGCERPLTLEFPDGSFGALAEAGMDDFARMKFGPASASTAENPSLRALLDSPADLPVPSRMPWRVLMLGLSPGALLEGNHLLLTLNEPSKIEDTSWIRPGKVMREVTLSTKGGKALVDFAAARNLQYMEYDAGWYGHEYDEKQDARTITPDPDRTSKIPNWSGLELQQVIGYAKSKGIGVILYVNRRHLETQLDELLPLYSKWGVAGLKYGFVNVGSQQWSKWLHDAVRKAAAHRLMVDIHDEYRPTGLSRTWPNLMTQEGILGNEAMPDATHNVTLPFTRGLAGAGDYTICYYTPRLLTTRPHQLALAVIMYSPWQFVFWYDQPSDFQGEPEIRFFEQLPTVWDDTRVVAGEIGKYISLARRKGDAWWLATANNTEARTLNLPLRFLKSGTRYLVDLYEEPAADNVDAKVSPRTKVAVSTCLWDAKSALRMELPPSGGHTAVFRPLPASGGELPGACSEAAAP